MGAGTVLWDVDGTLVRNGGRGGLLYDDAICDVTGSAPPAGPPRHEHGKTDAQIVAERLRDYGLDAALQDAVIARLDVVSVAGNSGPYVRVAAPGVAAALDAVEAAGWRNGLLTGNSVARVRAKLAGAGIEPDRFDSARSFFGDRDRVRADIALRARASLREEPGVVVGDTPSDGAAAEIAGLAFVAVATGVFPAEELRATKAVLVLTDLADDPDAFAAVLTRLAAPPA